MNHFSRNRVEDRVSFPSFDSLHTHTHTYTLGERGEHGGGRGKEEAAEER